MKVTLFRKFIVSLNIVTFLWVSTVVHASGNNNGKDADDKMPIDPPAEIALPVAPEAPRTPVPVAPPVHDGKDIIPLEPPVVEAPVVVVPPVHGVRFVDEFCERLVSQGRDFCTTAESAKSRTELLKACKESYERNMTIARREYNLAGKSAKERNQAFEDFYDNLNKKQKEGKISPRERELLEKEFYHIGDRNLTAAEHYRRCSDHARSAEGQAVRIQQYQMADTIRHKDPDRAGIAQNKRCIEYMDAQIDEILNLDKASYVDVYSHRNGKVRDAYEMAQEAKQLAEKCEGGKQEAATVSSWISKNKGWIIAGVIIAGLLVLCLATTAFSGLKFCKQKKGAEPKKPHKKKPKKCKTCKPGEPPVAPPPGPVPEPEGAAEGTFNERYTESDPRSTSASPGTFGDRSGGSATSGAGGSFGPRGDGSTGSSTPGSNSTFDSRSDSNNGQGVDSFGGRGDSATPR